MDHISLEELRLRLKNGADPQKCIPSRVSPLRWAATRGAAGVARLLIEYGHPIGKVLGYACVAGKRSTIKILLDAGADIDEPGGYIQTSWLCTPLMCAVNRDDEETVKYLLAKNAKTEVETPHEICSPLLQPLSPKVAKILLEAGANVNVRMSRLDEALTPLHLASDPDIARLLLDYGADVEAASAGGTPLRIVVISPPARYPAGAAEALIKLFVEYGADTAPGIAALQFAKDPNIVHMLTPIPKGAL